MMRMASPMSATRSLSVGLLARGRIFAAMMVPERCGSVGTFRHSVSLQYERAFDERCVNDGKPLATGDADVLLCQIVMGERLET